MDLLSGLNNKQKEAVQKVKGPVLILAGAGSGKTRTIMHRIAYIIEQGYASPYEILALTFTNKAAGEMRDRIENFGIAGTRDIWMGTFHSIFAKILRIEGHHLGFTNNFSIYDDDDTKKLYKEILKDLEISDKEYPLQSVKSTISLLKNNLETSSDYYDEYINGDDYQKSTIARIYDEYQKRLFTSNAMDFDDLLLNMNVLFGRFPEVLMKYQNRFKYILVDEYQDTNMCQYAIINKLASVHKNICVCGDDDQSIYGWRGASIRNILEFENDFDNTKIIKLEQNYRCTKNILNAANGVIDNNSERMGKTLFTDNETGEKISYVKARNDLEEASIIAREIFSKVEYDGKSYNDFAVLYRTNAQSRVLEEGLMRRAIPYQIVAGTKFYDRLEIKDILAYLKLIVNKKDDLALTRIINVPKRGIGPSTVNKLKEYAFMKDLSLFEIIYDIDTCPLFKGAIQSKLVQFRDTLLDIEKASESLDLVNTIIKTIQSSGYEQMLKDGKMEKSEARLENLDELVNAASDYMDSEEDASLSGFLENAALVAGVDSYDENSPRVLLMTLHNAKGLEFDSVFIPGMEEKLFPTYRAVEDEKELEEERRLCYVGITRAMKKLYVSCAEERRVYGRNEYRTPSRFLAELPEDLLEGKEQPKKEYISREKQLKSLNKIYDPYKANFNKKTQPVFNPETSPLDSSFKPGDKIKHSKWGIGTIVSTEGSGNDMKLTAAFPEIGIKKFALGYAKIEKVN